MSNFQHPTKWPNNCPLENRSNKLPSTAGIYAVVDGRGHAWYIGKSVNLNNRWQGSSHHRYEQSEAELRNPHLFWFTCKTELLDEYELPLIRYWKKRGEANWNNTKVPAYNKPWWHWFALDPEWAQFGLLAVAILLVSVVFSPKQPPLSPSDFTVPFYSQADRNSNLHQMLYEDAYVTPTGNCQDGLAEVMHGQVKGWVEISEFDQSVCD